MIVLLNPEREFTRKKSIVFKKLVIDEAIGDYGAYSFDFNSEKEEIRLNKSDVEEVNPEYAFVLKRFGLIFDRTTKAPVNVKAEIFLLDDGYMFFNLLEGAILVEGVDGEESKIFAPNRNIEITNGIQTPDYDKHVMWVSAEKIMSFTPYWCGIYKDFPYEFTYILNLSFKAAERNGSSGTLTIKPAEEEFLCDLSCGRLEEMYRLKEMRKTLLSKHTSGVPHLPTLSASTDESEDFVFDASKYASGDEDFDEDYYYEESDEDSEDDEDVDDYDIIE